MSCCCFLCGPTEKCVIFRAPAQFFLLWVVKNPSPEITQWSRWSNNLISYGEKWEREPRLFEIAQWSYGTSPTNMVNEIKTINCKFLKTCPLGSTYIYSLFVQFASFLSFSNPWFSFTPCTLPSFASLYFPLSLWRPLHGGQTWWWNMPRPSCVSTLPTWMQLLKFSPLTAGTVSPSSSCSTTSWG